MNNRSGESQVNCEHRCSKCVATQANSLAKETLVYKGEIFYIKLSWKSSGQDADLQISMNFYYYLYMLNFSYYYYKKRTRTRFVNVSS